MVRVVLPGASLVSLIDDPHLLAEEILGYEIDGDHDDEAGVEHKQPLFALLLLLAPSALQDQPCAHEVEHDRNP